MKIQNAADVPKWRMCIECGACAYASPEQKIVLYDVEEEGICPLEIKAGGFVYRLPNRVLTRT